MAKKTTNRPVHTVRAGRLSVSVWLNSGQNGGYYQISPQRSFREDGEIRNSASFSEGDVPLLNRLFDGINLAHFYMLLFYIDEMLYRYTRTICRVNPKSFGYSNKCLIYKKVSRLMFYNQHRTHFLQSLYRCSKRDSKKDYFRRIMYHCMIIKNGLFISE